MKPFLFLNVLFFVLGLSDLFSDLGAFSYKCISKGYFTSIHVLTVDPQEYTIQPVKALGYTMHRETVLTLATRHGAFAAVNGGFWKFNGDPAGILKIDHHWYGIPVKPRGAIGWTDEGKHAIIDRVLTNADLSQGNHKFIEVYPASNPPYTTKEEREEMEHIVGGAPMLINKGSLIKNYASEQTLKSFLTRRYPRTAVGIRENGEWVLVVVDGCFYGLLGGMTMKELADFMLKLGCIKALNLDGGGSSTMVINKVVMNKPSGKIYEKGKKVEAVSDVILIFPKNLLEGSSKVEAKSCSMYSASEGLLGCNERDQ